jgi:beta-lactamase superfamily II metal-dependent hydrolase
MIYNVILLPAKYGDAILIEYGDENFTRRILIDGGTGGTKKHIHDYFESLPAQERHLELLIVTHIDRDHIEGVLKILEQDDFNFTIKEIWFNGFKHLPVDEELEEFGAEQGERLVEAIKKHNLNWNGSFSNKAVVVKENENLPVITLEGGFKIVLLSPTEKELKALRPVWKKEVERAGLVPGGDHEDEITEDEITEDEFEQFGIDQINVRQLLREPFKEDDSEANGSSIGFVGEFEGKKVLFAGDSFPSVLFNSLSTMQTYDNFKFDLVKIAHHASHGNTSPDLLQRIECDNFAISTNGSIYYHPSKATVARIISSRTNSNLYFNYKTQFNTVWDDSTLKFEYNYATIFPQNGEEGIIVNLF